MTAPAFAAQLLGWKQSSKNKAGWNWVPNVADVDNVESLTLAAGMLDNLGVLSPHHASPNPTGKPLVLPPSNPGSHLENQVRATLDADLWSLDPARQWEVRRGALITDYAQYAHLTAIDALIRADPNLRVTVGRDYLIKPDVVVGLHGTPTVTAHPWMHAAVSCKWTIRSDRVQNIRHEFGQMIRHRRGRQPHLVTVTAEPLPTRLASIARGTGEVDATYHVAFDELAAAVAASSNQGQQDAWAEVVGQGRLRNYNLLADSLVAW
ncbi:NgoMIV family type II restriction endonuclease [Nocardioides euryhalodurans]|uniref:Restriction endonuclease n=1 Tax=Nocardioides euryhalodurans TaxID=2518370 RepID=A0A4P7GNS9_9ACTN|nr:NgoMIV family type II restriction endonuclease [Nocardioides euryhalodurans]QBR93750.1 restriction endonuclease [Nocardioides euryhalodurans]